MSSLFLVQGQIGEFIISSTVSLMSKSLGQIAAGWQHDCGCHAINLGKLYNSVSYPFFEEAINAITDCVRILELSI